MPDTPRNLATHQAAYVLDAQSTCPIVAGEVGDWLDSTDGLKKTRNADGTDTVHGQKTSVYDPVRLVDESVLSATNYDYDSTAHTFTAKTNNSQPSIDSVAPALNDRVLRVFGDAQDGIYAYTRVKGASVKAQWTRVADLNASGDFVSGAVVAVTAGSTFANTLWELTVASPFTMDSDTPTFTQTASAVTWTAISAAALTATTPLSLKKETSGAINVAASTTTNAAGGSLSATGGAGNGTGAGGASSVVGGAGGATGAGGAAMLTGGAAGGGNTAGGNAIVSGGAGAGTQTGGTAGMQAGAGGATGNGGTADVIGGQGGATSGNGGAVQVAGGDAQNGNGNGGDVNIDGGAKNGSGTDGNINIGVSHGTLITFGRATASATTANQISDPGDGQAIPVSKNGVVPLTVAAGAETNTLAVPTFIGQRLAIICDSVGGGSRAITSAAAINQAGNTIMTFAQAADFIELVGAKVGGSMRWRVAANDGVALS